MDTVIRDVRYALRTMRKSPVFTAIAVLCLALGIATNTTLFSCFNAIILRPFPFRDPEQLVFMDELDPSTGGEASISYPNFLDWRAGATSSFSGMGSWSGRSLTITEGEEPERIAGQAVSSNLFALLGVQPQLGRLFLDEEDESGAPNVVLLSDAVWRRRYASDSSVIGRSISINYLPYTVVGVMPSRFKFPQESELWVPAGPIMRRDARAARSSVVVGRLKPGVTVEQGDREIATVSRQVNEQYALRAENWVGSARELRLEFIPDDIRLIVSTMMGAVTFVLLIACANVANLMLMRAAGRQREMAVRAAIGAGRWRIARQLLTEAVILAVVAGIVAIPLTWEALRLLDGAMPPEDPLPYYIHWALDAPTLVYTALLALATGLIFGLAPAVQMSRGTLHDSLRDGARAGGSVRKNRLRSTLVVAEVALSLVLLVGASLFVRSFFAMRTTEVGFDPAPLLTTRFFLPGTKYDSGAARQRQVRDIVERVEALPGVESATVSNLIPMDGGGGFGPLIVEGVDVEAGRELPVLWTGTAGHWFATFDVAPTAGRLFTDAEMSDSAPVAVINEAMARRHWPGADPLGRRFRLGNDPARTWLTVVGVTPDIRVAGLDQTDPIEPAAYLSFGFLNGRNNGLIVRARQGDPVALSNAVRGAIRASDPAVPVFAMRSMVKVRDLSFWQYGLFGVMFALFGGIALFLAAIGVYGVIAYGVSQRTREIGVRVALGAQRHHVIGLVVRQGMTLAGVGIVLGLIGAFGVTRVVRSLLIGISPTDVVSFVGVTAFLGAVAFVASYFPARRATEVDPLVAIRVE